MVEWPFAHLVDAASAKAEQVPRIKHSMRGNDANDVGALGELIVADYLRSCGIESEDVAGDVLPYDLTTKVGTIEVKTKERTVNPLPSYECSIADLQRGRVLPDWYFFVSIRSEGKQGFERFKQAWLLGSMRGQTFWETAVKWEPGMVADNGWKPTIACWNVTVSQLRPPKVATVG